MPINFNTKYKVANRYNKETKKFDQNQFEFEDKGNFAVGKLAWSVPRKENGQTTFINSNIKFVCFGKTKDLIGSNLGAKFSVDASLANKPYKDKEGKWKDSWELTVFDASVVEEAINSHQKAKANGYQPDDEELSEVPF